MFVGTFAALAPGRPMQVRYPHLPKLVTVEQLAQWEPFTVLVVLHVAERAANYEEAHISGARFVRYGDIAIEGDARVGSELPPLDQVQRVFEAAGVTDDSRVVIYGTSTVAAARAFFTLDAMGHQHVALLDGGMRAWRAAGGRIESGPSPGAAFLANRRFSPRLNTARIVDAQFIERAMPQRTIALVDVRPDPEFLGTDGGMNGMHAPGHIAGAQQLPWDTLVGPDGRFLPRHELTAKLEAAGVRRGKPVVAYCMVGMRASVVYFVSRLLDYDARLYDGSIVDWSQKKLPTVTGRSGTQEKE